MKIGGSLSSIAADLHRRGVGAQEDVARSGRRSAAHRRSRRGRIGPSDGIDVEGVLEHPRRVAGRVVERREVVVVVLDLGTLDDPVAEADEDVLDLAPRPGQRVQVAEPDRRRARAASRRSRSAARRPSSSARSWRSRPPSSSASSSLRTSLPALPTGPRSLGRQLADAAQDRGQLRLAGRGSGPGPPRRAAASPAAAIAARASSRICSIRSSITSAPAAASDDIRCRPIAAAAATLSDSAPPRSGIVARRIAAVDELGGQPAALAPRQSVAGDRALPALVEVGCRRGRRGRAGARRSPPTRRGPAAPRTATPCWPGPPSASRHRRSPARGRRGPRSAPPPCG